MSAEILPPELLKRKAVVYVRQSTQTQVQTNLESQRRQYDLVEVARLDRTGLIGQDLRHLDMDDPAISALLAVLYPHTPTIERVPTIVNFNFLPDMGRMDAALRSVATTGCFLGATVAVGQWRS